jgi:hypothetical protein
LAPDLFLILLKKMIEEAVSCTGRKTVFCNFRELATVIAFKNLFGGPNGGKRCFRNPQSSIEGVKK